MAGRGLRGLRLSAKIFRPPLGRLDLRVTPQSFSGSTRSGAFRTAVGCRRGRRFDDFSSFYLNRLTFNATGPVTIGKWWLEHPNAANIAASSFSQAARRSSTAASTFGPALTSSQSAAIGSG
jgi:hypothetical protein